MDRDRCPVRGVNRYAASLGTPIVFSELAYLGDCDPAESTVPVTHATALPPSSAGTVAHLLELTHVEVTGTSSLDHLPVWSPLPRRALLMSAPDLLARTPQLTLVAAAHALRERGWDVRVLPHPREDRSLRHGVTLVDDETLAQSVSVAQVVVGYPGSALLPAAAMGAPVVAGAPTAAFNNVFPVPQAADRALVEAAVGPIGGASERLVNLWVAPLPR